MIIEYIAITIFGLLIGNFATTVFYRLPRNITLRGVGVHPKQPPFCSFCRHRLKFYEYLPVLSWISTLGKCNYCKHIIPFEYFILEIAATVLSYYCFHHFGGITDFYILIFIFSVLCVLSSLLYLEYLIVPQVIVTSMIAIGIIYRTLVDNSIFPWLTSISIAFIVSILIAGTGKNDKNRNNIINLLFLGSVWCDGYSIILYVITVCMLHIVGILCKKAAVLLYPISMLLLLLIAVS